MKRPIILMVAAFSVALVSQAIGTTMLAADKFIPIDIQSKANGKLDESFGSGRAGSDLKSLPRDEQVFGGVKFFIGEKLIQLGSMRTEFAQKPEKVEDIKVDRKLERLYFLHAVQNGGYDPWKVADDTLVGEYRVNFEDRTAIIIPIVFGVDVRDWFYAEGDQEPSRNNVVWTGGNAASPRFRLFMTSFENPWPNKKITTIDFFSKKSDTMAAPFCVAITAEKN